MTRAGLVGLGYWGPNLARNFDHLAELTWLCDTDEGNHMTFAARFPRARMTADYAEMLADPELDAIVVATVPTHYALAKKALEAGKHVLVEKPPAMKGAEMDELVVLGASERDLVLMPGHLLLYHPGVRKLKELVDSGELGEVLCVYTNRQNLGIVRANENALWSLGVHDLSVILWLIGETRSRCQRTAATSSTRGRGRRLLLPPLPVGEDRPHAPLLARPAQDAEDDRRRQREDGRVRRHGAGAEGDRLREGPWKQSAGYGEWQTRTGDIHIPKIDTAEPLRLECQAFLDLIAGEGDRRAVAEDGAMVVRALDRLTESLRG